jgi:hypothetical protein
VKAWSVKEGDDRAQAALGNDIAAYDKRMALGEFERRRAVGSFFFEKHEQTRAGHEKCGEREVSFSGWETNPFFHNLGGGKFANLTAALGTALTDDGRAVAAMDLDRDGDQDLVVHNVFRPHLVALRNDVGRGRTVVVSLRAKKNRFGVGALAVAEVGGRRQAQEMTCGSGYLSGQPLELVFGLGASAQVDKLTIAWPGGAKEAVFNLEPGRVTIEEGVGIVAKAPHATAAPAPLPPPERVLREGDRFALDAETIDGATVAWPAGRPFVAWFWSGYCKSCERELPNLRSIAGELKRVDPAIELVPVNVDGEPEKIRDEHKGAPLAIAPVLARGTARGALTQTDPVVPVILVVGADGVIRARHVGALTPAGFAELARKALR